MKRVVVGNKFLYESVTARASVLIARCRSEVKRISLLLHCVSSLDLFPSLLCQIKRIAAVFFGSSYESGGRKRRRMMRIRAKPDTSISSPLLPT